MDWQPSIKFYPHFDKSIRPSDIKKLVSNPARVASNSFYPFLKYTKSHQPFRKTSGKPDKKRRPIRFASRRDAYIFSYYRKLLADLYEPKLAAAGISECVIAYRKLKTTMGAGKSNIEFAFDAVADIRRIGNAAVVTMDIASFFESMCHEHLLKMWCWLLGVKELPADHRAVYKAVTRYAVVDREAAYERLGYLERETIGGTTRLVYKTKFDEMPKQLCSNKEFRAKICGEGGAYKSLIEVNRMPFGIPQGSPISDLLANVYLFDFDLALNSYAAARGGKYYRYSDDVILILPGGAAEATSACDFVRAEIRKYGSELKIKDRKTSVVLFEKRGLGQAYKCLAGAGKNGVEYLGFRYDGEHVRIRDSTLSNLYRKVTLGIRAEVQTLIKRYPGRSAAFLEASFNESSFLQKYGRVEEFSTELEFSSWTFWTYARRAMNVFGDLGVPIAAQLKNYKRIVRSRVGPEIARAL